MYPSSIHDKQPLFLCSRCFCKWSAPMSWGNVACDYSKLDNTWILCWTTLIIRLIGQHHNTPARTITKTTTIIVTIIIIWIVIITMIIRLITINTIINYNQLFCTNSGCPLFPSNPFPRLAWILCTAPREISSKKLSNLMKWCATI